MYAIQHLDVIRPGWDGGVKRDNGRRASNRKRIVMLGYPIESNLYVVFVNHLGQQSQRGCRARRVVGNACEILRYRRDVCRRCCRCRRCGGCGCARGGSGHRHRRIVGLFQGRQTGVPAEALQGHWRRDRWVNARGVAVRQLERTRYLIVVLLRHDDDLVELILDAIRRERIVLH